MKNWQSEPKYYNPLCGEVLRNYLEVRKIVPSNSNIIYGFLRSRL